MQKVRVVYTRTSMTGRKSAPNVLFIIHYLRMRSFKTDRKIGPAGPLATAMLRAGKDSYIIF